MKIKRVIPAFGISNGGCALEFIDRESYVEHARWEAAIELGQVIDPVLPAVMIRIASNGGEPPVFFYEGDERAPTSTAEIAACKRAASPEAAIEDWAAVALEKPSEPELAMRAKFWKEKREFYENLKAMSPGQLTQFFAEQVSPLLVPFDPQTKDSESHDLSI